MSEIVHYLRHAGSYERYDTDGPRARMPSNMSCRIRYQNARWGFFGPEFVRDLRTNSLGFRDEEFDSEPGEEELRWMCLGDSFTFGIGVDLEETWPQLIESDLQDRLGRPVEVINAGFAAGSHYPPGYLPWLKSDGVLFSPSLLVLGICLNDLHKKIPTLAYPRPDPKPVLGGRSRLLHLVRTVLAERRQRGVKRNYGDVVRADPGPWQEVSASLLEMKQLLAEHNCEFVVAILPMLSQLDESYPYRELHELVAEFCGENDVRYVDLFEAVNGEVDRDLWVHRSDQHPNGRGHRLLADGLLESLEQGGLIP